MHAPQTGRSKKIGSEAENSNPNLAKNRDRMVTPVPEYEDIPTPPQPGGNIRTNKQEGTSSAPPQMEDYVINEQKKKMTLLPPGKKDNPKTVRQYKKKTRLISIMSKPIRL